MYIVLDAENTIIDMASATANLTREGTLLRPEKQAAVAWAAAPMVGDHIIDGQHVADSPTRAAIAADRAALSALEQAIAALQGVQAKAEARVGALTVKEIAGWVATIDNVAAAANAAQFATRWQNYELHKTLLLIKLAELVLRR